MLNIISGAIQLIFLILNNYFEKDKEEKKRKEDIHAEWVDVIKSGDKSRINALIDKLRQ